jgi:uncharacterized iron-regulated membrane protein
MSVLHTWTGVVLGSVLFAMFWMGTLSVFDREIDRWMMPGTRRGPPPALLSLDETVKKAARRLAPEGAEWSVALPTDRTPTLQLRYEEAGQRVVRHVDPVTGEVAGPQGTLGGTGFIFPFHFNLHLEWMNLGEWLVGLAGMAMLVLLVSGVVIHRRIFKDFFTFRPLKAASRSALDLHNVMGVLPLPFHFVMPLSGLIIFFSVYFPGTWQATYGADRATFSQEVFGRYQRTKAGVPAALGSLDAMAAEAERHWSGGKPSFVRVLNPGDASGYVEIRRSVADDVSMNLDQIYFDAVDGTILQRFEAKPVMAAQRFIAGIHFVQFDHWTLRWLYFFAGLAGCVVIATGFLFWLESRRARHATLGLVGVRCVEALCVGSVPGIILATLAFFVANRLLPAGAGWTGLSRTQLEVAVFYAAWLGSFGHAGWRAREAWAEQCWGIAGLAFLAVLLNGLTTGDHLLRSLQRGVWSVAGMDGVLLLGSGIAWASARRLRSRAWARRPGAGAGATLPSSFDEGGSAPASASKASTQG